MDDTIISAIEKLSRTWRLLLFDVGKNHALSPLQTQIVIILGQNAVCSNSISQIADELGLTKSTVSEAVTSLQKKGLLTKNNSQKDKRRCEISLTEQGRALLHSLALWSDSLKEQLQKFSVERKEEIMLFLMELLISLKNAGVIRTARMCFNCENFLENVFPCKEDAHYCKLIETPRRNSELRIDCNNFIPKREGSRVQSGVESVVGIPPRRRGNHGLQLAELHSKSYAKER